MVEPKKMTVEELRKKHEAYRPGKNMFRDEYFSRLYEETKESEIKFREEWTVEVTLRRLVDFAEFASGYNGSISEKHFSELLRKTQLYMGFRLGDIVKAIKLHSRYSSD